MSGWRRIASGAIDRRRPNAQPAPFQGDSNGATRLAFEEQGRLLRGATEAQPPALQRAAGMIRFLLIPLAMCAAPLVAQTPTAGDYRADARSIEPLIDRVYAYPERLPGGAYRLTDRLRAEADQVGDERALLHFAERAMLLLADHHAITGASFNDSWGLVPSYADLWIERRAGGFAVDAVRPGSPAARGGIRPGDRLVAIGGTPVDEAVAAFWADLGVAPGARDAAFAARVLAAGRRNAPRRLTLQRGTASPRTFELPNLYAEPHPDRPPVGVATDRGALRIRFNDSLGEQGTIAAFDAAMALARPGQRIVLDLADTPSGGNSSVARAILGWFVDRPRFFQMHNDPSELRETGIARQWVEQVLPRAGKHHRGRVKVLVGRWTGSMGEGLAIGFDAIGARVVGTRMAGLRGAVDDERLEHSGLVLKLPAERVMTVGGLPRENFVPHPR
jgi:C-terminal processing protease CtpA/Prc